MFSDGTVFFGKGIGILGDAEGEICFNTSLTGYQEILTDPSYAGQIITFTFPHIGNVGTNEEDVEAREPAARGLVIREDITAPSNYRNQGHLNDWLKSHGFVGICGVDTRAITKKIRLQGAQNVIVAHVKNAQELDVQKLLQKAKAIPSLKGTELAKVVTVEKPYSWNQSAWVFGKGYPNQTTPKFKVVAVDYGTKFNILRSLSDVGCDVTVVPADTSAEKILSYNPDGIFLSNGPGDPAETGLYALSIIKELLKTGLPLFGICLGHQLLALALGCTTEKMFQGHRGANHPVQDLRDNKVIITSQNHGFVVSQETLPKDVEVTHISLFDKTIQGIQSKTFPAFSVQGHPEASPGPHDSIYLFQQFVELMEQHQGSQGKARATGRG
ncbi:MAG: carbamoyl phosphate synthase small subunit [Rickettsiales bacterium]|nr:carbamoyl phosphate synthase small subunit [Rickettsiales bacterium]